MIRINPQFINGIEDCCQRQYKWRRTGDINRGEIDNTGSLADYDQHIVHIRSGKNNNAYSDDVKDIDYSAYEHLRMLHDRTQLEKVKHELDMGEKILLSMFDLILLKNTVEMAKHIGSVYDFTLSDTNGIPLAQWWWHLDKVAKGNLYVEDNPSTEKVIIYKEPVII
jgi:hypothetical protein